MATREPEFEELGRVENVERALLGSLLFDHEAIAEISAMIIPECFTNLAYRDIYRAMLACWKQRIPGDFVNVDAQLQSMRSKMVGPADLPDLLDSSITATYVMYYAKRVANAHRFRLMNEAYGVGMQLLASNPDLDPAEVLQGVLGKVLEFGAGEDAPMDMAQLAPAMSSLLDDERNGLVDIRPIPTGFGALNDELNGGIKLGELVILAARPSQGKTALAVSMAMYASSMFQSMIFSLEMDADALMRRMVSVATQIPYTILESGRVTNEQMVAIRRSLDHLARLPIVIDDNASTTVDQIRVRIMRQQAKGPVGLVVVDYLELVGDKHPNEEQRLSNIAKELKQIAKELRVCIVLLSQLSREVERRTPPIPRLSDLRYSGSLEAVADKIMFVYREAYYVERGMLTIGDCKHDPGIAEIRIDKNRNGSVGKALLHYNGPTLTFSDPNRQRHQAEQASIPA